MKFKGRLFLLITFITAGVLLELYWPILVAQFFELFAMDQDKNITILILFKLLFFLLILDFSMTGFWSIIIIIESKFSYLTAKKLIDDSFDYLHKHSYRFFSDNFGGALVKKIQRLESSNISLWGSMIYKIIPMALFIIFVTVYLLFLNFWLGVILFVWSVLFVVINYYLALYKLKYDVLSANVDTRVTAFLSDTISNNINLKLFGSLARESGEFKKITHEYVQKSYKSSSVNGLMNLVVGMGVGILEVMILYFAINMWYNGEIDIPGLFIIQAYVLTIIRTVFNFCWTLRDLFRCFSDSEEMVEVLSTPYEVKDKSRAKDLIVKNGKIEFQKVRFSYQLKKKKTVIRGLNFRIKPGEKVALVGPSGSGKTTIVKLLLRFFNIKEGVVLIDGQDISRVKQDSLRKNIAVVPQDPILFHRSIYENIQYGNPDAGKEEVYAAAKMANCYEFIMDLPEKFEAKVGERGIKLSGGQRQRISIARAILMNAKILVLDEATSSLDSESERKVKEALDNLMGNKTTLIIAHRLSTIMSCDRVLVLNDGEIVEEGTHDELISNKNGLYKKLWNLQVKGFFKGSKKESAV